MHKSWSQAGQDLFVIDFCNYKKNGTYVEIGAFHSTDNSNTYLLESEFEWSGISFEIAPHQCEEFNMNRLSPCILADATQVDYQSIFRDYNLPKLIDYLQVDIDPAPQSYKALELVMSTDYKFRTITFEHDLYEHSDHKILKDNQKQLLSSLGYTLYKENICWDKDNLYPFEDWWVLNI